MPIQRWRLWNYSGSKQRNEKEMSRKRPWLWKFIWWNKKYFHLCSSTDRTIGAHHLISSTMTITMSLINYITWYTCSLETPSNDNSHCLLYVTVQPTCGEEFVVHEWVILRTHTAFYMCEEISFLDTVLERHSKLYVSNAFDRTWPGTLKLPCCDAVDWAKLVSCLAARNVSHCTKQ